MGHIRYDVGIVVPSGLNPLFETRHIEDLYKLCVTSDKAFHELGAILVTLYRHLRAPEKHTILTCRLLSQTSLRTCAGL